MKMAGSGFQSRVEVRQCALQEHPAPEDPAAEDSDSDSSQVLEHRSTNNSSQHRNPPNLRSDLEDPTNYCDDTTSYSSASSWTNDRFERRATAKVQRIFENIESHLYDGVVLPNEFEDLKEECRDWVAKFPHLWVVGRRVPISNPLNHVKGDQFECTSGQFIDRRDLVADCDHVDCNSALENDRFFLKGLSLKPFSTFEDDKLEEFVEDYEELIAVDYGEEIGHYSGNSFQPSVDTESLQRCIVERLTEHIWKQVFSHLRPTLRSYVEFTLRASRVPSATEALGSEYPSSKRKFPLPRLPTAVLMNKSSADLEGVLTISSKTLQNRGTEKGIKVPPVSTTSIAASSGSGGAISQSSLRAETRGKGRLVPLDHGAASASTAKTSTSTDTKQQNASPIRETFRGAISKSWSRHFTLPPIDGVQQPNVAVLVSQTSKSPLSSLTRTVSEPNHPNQENNSRRSISKSPTSYVTPANPRMISRIPTAINSRTQPSLNLAINTLVISEGKPGDLSIQSGSSKAGRRRSSVTAAAGSRNQDNFLLYPMHVAYLRDYPLPPSYRGIEIPEKNKLKAFDKVPQYPAGIKPLKCGKRLMDIRGPELVHNKLIHEQYGIIALTGGYLRHGHLEMIRNIINRKMDVKNTFAVWRIDPPWKPITKKSQGKRMGGGKGSINHYVTPVKAGRVIVEVGGRVEYALVKPLLVEIIGKLPFLAKCVTQEILKEMALEEQRRETENINPYPFKYLVDNNMLGCHSWITAYDHYWYGKYR